MLSGNKVLCNNSKDHSSSRTSRGECLDCDNYKRKIKESEQSLSDRDVLISMLQKEIQKREDLYKKSIDEYEKLRFAHCTTVQELSHLKEIQKKYEKDYDNSLKEKYSKKEAAKTESCNELWENQYSLEDITESPENENQCPGLENKPIPSYDKSLENRRQLIQSEKQQSDLRNKSQLLQNEDCCGSVDNSKSVQFENHYPKNSTPSCLVNDVFKDVSNIEHLIQKQGQTLKSLQVLFSCNSTPEHYSTKHLSEGYTYTNYAPASSVESAAPKTSRETTNITKDCKECTPLVTYTPGARMEIKNVTKYNKECTAIIEDVNNQIRDLTRYVSKLKAEFSVVIEDTKLQSTKLRDLVLYLKEENIAIKSQLTEKSAALTSCLTILEQNHSDINNLSATIENIMREKEHYLQDIRTLKQTIEGTKQEYKSKDQEIRELKLKLNASSQEGDNENSKENLELKKELNKYRQNIELLQNDFAEKEKSLYAEKDSLKKQFGQLEESNKVLGDTLGIITTENKCNLNKIITLSRELSEVNKEFENSVNALKMCMLLLQKHVEEQKNKENSSEQTEIPPDSESSILQEDNKRLSTKIISLEKELQEATLENSEYEEENKCYSQKLDSSCAMISNLKNLYEIGKSQREKQIKELKDEIHRLKGEDCKTENEELKKKINVTENEIKTVYQQKEKVDIENKNLQNQIKELQLRCNCESDKLKDKLVQIQEKLNTVQKEKNKIDSSYENLHNQMKKLHQQCVAYGNENLEIKNKIHLINEELNKIREEKLKINNENQNLKSRIEKLQENDGVSEEGIAKRIDMLKEQLIAATEENMNIFNENKNLKIQSEKLQQNLLNYDNKNKETELKIDALSEELKLTREENIKIKDKNKILNSQLEQCSNGCEETKNKANRLNDELKLVLGQKAMIDNENKNLKTQIEDIQKRLSTHYDKNEEVEQKINMLSEELKAAQEKIAKFEDENKVLNHLLDDSNNEREDMKKEIERLNEELKEKSKTNRLEDVQQHCCECVNNENEQIKEKNNVSSGEQTLEGKASIHDENENLKKQIEEEKTKLNEENKSLRSQIEKIQEKLSNNVKGIKELELKITMLNEELKTMREEKVTIENENKDLSSQIKDLKKRCSECNTGCQEIKKERDILNKNLKTALEEKEKIDHEYENLKTEMKSMQQNLSDYSNRNKEMEENITVLKEELNRALEEKAKFEKDNNFLNNQLEDMIKNCVSCKKKDPQIEEEIALNIDLQKARKENDKFKNGQSTEDLEEKKNDEEDEISNAEERDEVKRSCPHCEKLKSKIGILREKIRTAYEEKEKIEKENRNLKIQLENLQHPSAGNSGNEELKNENDNVSEKFQSNENIKTVESHTKSSMSSMRKKEQEDIFDDDIEQTEKGADTIKEKANDDKNMKLNENDDTEKKRSLKSQLEEFQQNCLKCNKENKEIKGKMETMNEELRKVYEEKAEVDGENKNLKDQINSLQKELTDIQNKTDNAILLLQTKIDELENGRKDIIKYVSQIEELETQKDLLKQETFKLDNEKQELLKELGELKDKLCKYEKSFQECEDAKSLNEKLQKDVETVDVEICRRECMISHLEWCLDRSNKTLDECDKQMKELHKEVENLKSENEELKKQLQKYVYEAEVNKAEAASLQEKLNTTRKQIYEVGSPKSKDKDLVQYNPENPTNMSKEYNDLLEINKEKEEELQALREQLKTLQKSSELTTADYQKMKTAYKELKNQLAQQITNYKEGFEILKDDFPNSAPCYKPKTEFKPCKGSCMRGLEPNTSNAYEKETEVKSKQYKNEDISSDIFQLNKNMKQLFSDNKILRKAINDLLSALLDKLNSLSDSGEDVSNCCASLIANGILNSLVDLEKQFTQYSKSSVGSKCNCMSVIMSTYKIDKSDQTLPNSDSKCVKCIKCQNKDFGSNSEIFNTPIEFREDTTGKSNDPGNKDDFKNGRCDCSGIPSKENCSNSENEAEDPETEPFVIEPDERVHL